MTKLVQPTTKLSPKFIKVQLVYARAKLIEVEIKQSFGLANIPMTGRGAPVRHATLRDVTWYYARTEDVRRS